MRQLGVLVYKYYDRELLMHNSITVQRITNCRWFHSRNSHRLEIPSSISSVVTHPVVALLNNCKGSNSTAFVS